MVIWNLAYWIIIPVCVALDMLDFIYLYFVLRGQIACPDFSSGESRQVNNHTSVCRLRHARFHIATNAVRKHQDY